MKELKTINKQQFKMINRREFLRAAIAVGATAAVPQGIFAKAKRDFDPNLSVFFADMHIGSGDAPALMKKRFMSMVAEVLKLDPLPARAVLFGDLAHLTGKKADYLESAPILRLLRDAGMEVVMTMGNHDSREAMDEVYPGTMAKSPVPGRWVSITDLGTADLILLDSFEPGANPGCGGLNGAQQEWLKAELPRRKRPVFVGAHHHLAPLSVGGEPLGNFLARAPMVAGYIYGHVHYWSKSVMFKDWQSPVLKRALCLPSTGFWGDIGYALFRTGSKSALATLVQKDVSFPVAEIPRPERPKQWDVLLAENQGQKCRFVY